MDPSRLRDIPLFAALGARDLEKLGRWSDEIAVPAGTTLSREGGLATEFFVILDGTATVDVDGSETATLGSGDFFGEIGLLVTQGRTATIRARTPMRPLVVFGREFRELERTMPIVARRVREAVAARLARV